MCAQALKQETKQSKKQEQIKIRGILSRVRFNNQTNGWSVLQIEKEDGTFFTAVGNMPSLRTGDQYEFTGIWKEHPQYGPQLAFTECKVILPEGKQGAAAYLTTLTFGIGPKKAKKIVDALGENALQVIIKDPTKLMELGFVTQQQAQDIIEALAKNTILAELSAMICKQGVTPALAARIYAQYGSDSINIVKENPYILSEDVWGIGFKKADAVAQAIGVKPNSPFRVEAALKYMLKEAGQEGHVYLRPRDTVDLMPKLLGKGSGVDIPEIKAAAQALIARGEIIREGDAMYHKTMYEAEVNLARNMRKLATQDPIFIEGLDELVEEIQEEHGVAYAPEQKEAIKTAMSRKITIVTGGPGTGKTTVIKGILTAYERIYGCSHPVYLASPTGRAAKRMTEATGQEAKTIHRLLAYNPFEGGFTYNEKFPLEPGLMIIDEYSMADIELSDSLFKAITENMQVVLVGDIDQLPSVGPGSVLRDAIISGVVPTVKLRFNYRQAGGSIIAENAHHIVRGDMPPLYERERDWETRRCIENEDALEIIKGEVRLAIERGLSIMDFQVLAPMRRGPCGVDNLNQVVRELVNPPSEGKPELKRGRDNIFRLGDKVMVTKNNYRLGVFNGDLGIITEVAENGAGLRVDFEGEEVFFNHENVDILTLAYTSTIHKSQGSEFPLAIVVCVRSHWIMLQRNLLYTGITRAKDRLVLVCQEEAVERCVRNNEIKERRSLLAERLRGECKAVVNVSGNNDSKELSSPEGAQ